MADTTLTVENLSSLKVADLKRELKVRGLAVSGNKTELLERLQIHLEEDPEEKLDSDAGDASLTLNDTSLTLNDPVAEDSLLQDEKDILETPIKNKSEDPPVRQKITMSDTADVKNGHEATKKPVSSEEALKARSERFGVQSVEEKKKSRADRFGITATTTTTTAPKPSGKLVNTPVTADDMDKLKKRAERFGTVVSTSLSKAADVEKLKQRSERFGAVLAPALSKVEEEEKIRKRKERFGALSGGTTLLSSDEIEAKKMKRAERFEMS